MATNGDTRRAELGDGRGEESAFSSTAQVAAAARLAEVLVVGFASCEAEGRPLSELQKIDLLSVALAAFDGHRDELEVHLGLSKMLAELGREERRQGRTPLRLQVKTGGAGTP